MLSKQENAEICGSGHGTPIGEWFRRFWLPALLPDELPSPDCPPIRVTLLGEKLVAFRDSSGKVGFVVENCPHRGASLFFGRNEEQGLRCVYHGWKFDVDGRCVDMPSEPAESNFKAKVAATAYPAREWAGVVWIYMGPAGAEPQLPEFEWTRVRPAQRYIGKYIVAANYLQVIEGSIDTVHVSFLHRGADSPELQAQLEAAGRGRGGRALSDFSDVNPPTMLARETDYGVMVMARRNLPENKTGWRVTQVFLPSYAMLPGGPDGGSLLGTVPIDDTSCFCWRWSWNVRNEFTTAQIEDMNGGSKRGGVSYPELIPGTLYPSTSAANDYLIDRELQRTLNFTGVVGSRPQDQVVTESMGAMKDRAAEHLATTDRGIISTRRRILRSARDLAKGIEPLAARDGSLYHIRSGAITTASGEDLETDPSARQALMAKV